MTKHQGMMAVTVEGEYADIDHMRTMSVEGYRNYLKDQLFWVDHHGILRDVAAEYPVVTSKEQLDALIAYLREEVEPRLEA